MERLRWDYTHPDHVWPGFLVYLQEKNYDTSKVGIVAWDPVRGKNVILDDTVDDSGECERFKLSLCWKC